jgi:hypothetical protein
MWRRQMYFSNADLISAAHTIVISSSIGYEEGFKIWEAHIVKSSTFNHMWFSSVQEYKRWFQYNPGFAYQHWKMKGK